jgi:hypothetical protein
VSNYNNRPLHITHCEKCGKELVQIWENHARDIFRDAKKIAEENKK